MHCPASIEPTILEIIRCALLNIRSLGWDGKAAGCALEADHVHNLPNLIQDYSEGALKYYLGPGRAEYAREMQESATGDLHHLQQLWDQLERFVAQNAGSTPQP